MVAFYISRLENKNKYSKIALLSARIVVVNSDPSSVVGFPDFLEDNWLLQVSKNVTLSFNCLRTGIKRSYSLPSQDYTADNSSNRCFECSKMQLLEPMCENSHC